MRDGSGRDCFPLRLGAESWTCCADAGGAEVSLGRPISQRSSPLLTLPVTIHVDPEVPGSVCSKVFFARQMETKNKSVDPCVTSRESLLTNREASRECVSWIR